MEPQYRNILVMAHKSKGIPYWGSGKPRSDGDMNYGFQDLKGQPELLDDVPELQTDAALRSLMAAISGRGIGLFSVGCLSAMIHDEHGHRMTGYVEFALNSARAAADAASYFPIFFHFDRHLEC